MSERYEDRFFTNRDGLRLHCRDYPGSGDKPPLLCLPGLTRNSRDFAELAERYSPGHQNALDRLIWLDQRAGLDPCRYVQRLRWANRSLL